MKKFRIYTSYHKPGAFLSAPSVIPLHVGKATSLNTLCCEGDDRGDNISYKNPFYCELTAQYWAWKNGEPAEYVGFMHYRRHLNFSEQQDYEEDLWGVVVQPEIDTAYEEKFQLTDAGIERCLQQTDILLPKAWPVSNAGSRNNYIHYGAGDDLHIEDYDLALATLYELYPDYRPDAEIFNQADCGYYTNMFVMKRELFNEYSEWLFSILEALEKKISFRNYNAREQRVIGHIAERLFNIFILHKRSQRPELVIKEVQRTFIEKETFNGKIPPAFDGRAVPVVICFDDNYSISGAALIHSLLKNSDDQRNYDIVILENGISSLNKQRLYSLVKDKKSFSLRFFDINTFTELSEVHTRGHFTSATYARLFIPRLFSLYDKVLFIDADTVTEEDVGSVYDTDLGDHLVAAVRDIVMEGFVKFGAISDSSDGQMPARKYLLKTLGMTRTENYFQAGVILFNISQMNKENTFDTLMEAMKEKHYWFLDQDIMNKVFYDRVFYLPLEWNVYHGNGNTHDFFPNLCFSTYMEFLSARLHPKLIHYAGENKPWNTIHVDFYDNFEKYLSGTPWQRELYWRLAGKPVPGSHGDTIPPGEEVLLLQTRIKRKLMPLLNRCAPTGSPRRNFLIKYYYAIRRRILG